jgi:hypothetical protein
MHDHTTKSSFQSQFPRNIKRKLIAKMRKVKWKNTSKADNVNMTPNSSILPTNELHRNILYCLTRKENENTNLFEKQVHTNMSVVDQPMPRILSNKYLFADSIAGNLEYRKRKLGSSNWRGQKVATLIGTTAFKAGNLIKKTPVSSFIRASNKTQINRPYNSQTRLPELIRQYRKNKCRYRQYKQWYSRNKIAAFARNLDDNVKIYRLDLKGLTPNIKNLPYTNALGHTIGKLNPTYLPWIRKRGSARTHLFRRRLQKLSVHNELTPYKYLLRKRPSRLFQPARLKLNKILTDAEKENYVLSQLQNYPLKAQSISLESLIYT